MTGGRAEVTMRPEQETIAEILQLTRVLARTVARRTFSAWSSLDLTKGLFCLATAGEATVSYLATRLHVSSPTASHLVERLVQAGLARRVEDPEDRRRTLVYLTEQGESLYAQLREWSHAEQLRGWLEQLTQAELDALATGLRALARAAEADRRSMPVGAERAPVEHVSRIAEGR
jgi:DNA-binding MarR family transcriptional regulator